MTIDEPGTSSEKIIPQNHYPQRVFKSDVDGEQCVKSFRTLNAVNSHIAADIKDHNRVACGYVINGEVCGDMFASVAHLKSHMHLTHYSEKPYTYDELNKTFTKDNPFNSYIKGNPYFCDKIVGDGICGKSFKERGVFMIHFRTHIAGRFLCEHRVNGEPCGKSFIYQAAFNKHTATHAIEENQDNSLVVKIEPLEIVPYEAGETSNASNEVGQMTIEEPDTSAEAFLDKTIPQNNPIQSVSCGHVNVNGDTCGKIFISEDDLKIHIGAHVSAQTEDKTTGPGS